MTISKSLLSAAVAAVLLTGATAANAVTVYTFDATAVGEFGAGPYGTVTLNQSGSDVLVSVLLRSDLNFVTTGGPHSTFAFMLDGATTSDITNILFDGASNLNYTVVAPGVGTPFGTNFSLMIDCTGGGCANGAPGQISDPLTFTVLNAFEADFATSFSNGGAYFSADVICGGSSLAGCNGATGTIAVTGGPSSSSTSSSSGDVPEPGPMSLTLLGLGLLGAGFMRRARQSA